MQFTLIFVRNHSDISELIKSVNEDIKRFWRKYPTNETYGSISSDEDLDKHITAEIKRLVNQVIRR